MSGTPVVVLANEDATREALQLLAGQGIDVTLATLRPAPEGTLLAPVKRTIDSGPRRKLANGELSQREIQVLRLISEGNSNPEIAARLFLARSTINSHVKRLFGKLGVNDRVSAVIVALRAGLIEAPS